jgi:Fe-S-cluster containining protein
MAAYAMKAEHDITHPVNLPALARDIPSPVQEVLASYQTRIAKLLLRIGCLDGLEAFAFEHSLPHQFLVLLQRAMGLFDESSRFFVNYLRREGLAVPCQEGCAHCCQNMPAGTSLVELLYCYHGMHQSGAFPRLFRRSLEAEQVLTQLLLVCQDKCRGPLAATDESYRDQVLQLYQSLGKPCGFSRDNLCQLYPYRPFACRLHYSLSPAYWCDPRHFQFPHARIINLAPSNCVLDALDRIERRLRMRLSEILVCGILELTVNVMRFDRIRWKH